MTVRRFPVLRRDKAAFDAVNHKIMSQQAITLEEEGIFLEEFIRSPELIGWIRANRSAYIFFFIPYLFPTTYWGLSAAPESSVLIPCMHDEGYASLDLLRAILPQAQRVVCHTQSEIEFMQSLFKISNHQIRKIGVGINTNFRGDGDRFRAQYRLQDTPFVLYAGRRDFGKNIPQLLADWTYFKRRSGHPAKLVLMGPGQKAHIPYRIRGEVIDLGYLSRESKWDAFAAADVFVMPSFKESFSIVLMASWLMGTPAIVNGRCDVTVEHARRSNGGLFYNSTQEFMACLNWLFKHPLNGKTMGQNGRQYVLEHFTWPQITAAYIGLIEELLHQNDS
ncbi:MAG: glycosyltransferase family 4 protein [Chloroflexota bacterium]